MRRFSFSIVLALSTLLLVSVSAAQQAATTTVPNLIRYSGTLKDAQGAVPSGTPLGVTFAIYKQQDGGAAVWQETQNVTPDANGQYSVVLGSTTASGLPDDLFSQQEQRWLGVQVQGQAEQARVLLVSVPYAFKAHEADTLGGLPPSAFVKASPASASGGASTDAGALGNASSSVNAGKNAAPGKPPAPGAVQDSPCTPATPAPAAGSIPVFLKPSVLLTVICDSVIFQDAFGDLSIATATPGVHVDVKGRLNLVSGISPGAYFIDGGRVLGIQGVDNTFVGSGAGVTNSGNDNTYSGYFAGGENTGSYNTISGSGAGLGPSTGSGNAYFGYQAGNNEGSGGANAFFGLEAGVVNTDGSGNAFFGANSGFGNTTGSNNTFSGFQSGFGVQFKGTGSYNTFTGSQSGYSNTTGETNTFTGSQSGYSNTTGETNTFTGSQSGYANTTGETNTFTGSQSGYANTTGYFNAFFGSGAGEINATGYADTYLGANAGSGGFNTNGSGNIYVGWEAGEGVGNGDYNIEIGAFGLTADAQIIRIGGYPTNQTDTYVQGIYNSTPGNVPNFTVCVDVNGKLWGVAAGCNPNSSRRFKEKILDMGDSSSKLFQLRPVTFFYKPQYDDGSHLQQYGLIAEEVSTVYPEMTVYDKDGQPSGVKYQLLAPMLLNELQKQHAVVAAQQDVIKTQQEQMQTQAQQLAELQQRLTRLEALIAKK